MRPSRDLKKQNVWCWSYDGFNDTFVLQRIYLTTLNKLDEPNKNVILCVFESRTSLCFQVCNVIFRFLGIQNMTLTYGNLSYSVSPETLNHVQF